MSFGAVMPFDELAGSNDVASFFDELEMPRAATVAGENALNGTRADDGLTIDSILVVKS